MLGEAHDYLGQADDDCVSFSSSMNCDPLQPPAIVSNGCLAQSQCTAVAMNNCGVSLLGQGKYRVAMQALADSLRLCRANMVAVKTKLASARDGGDFRQVASLDQCFESSMRTITTELKSSAISRGHYYVFGHAILMPATIGTSSRECSLLAVVTTFNLALARQLAAYAMIEQNEDRMLLQNAARTYELAFAMQSEENFQDNALFALAVVNNLGIIHAQMRNAIEAKHCFEYLLSTLMYLSSRGEHRASFEGFFKNVHSKQLISTAPAA